MYIGCQIKSPKRLRGSSLVVHRCLWFWAKRGPHGNIEHISLFEHLSFTCHETQTYIRQNSVSNSGKKLKRKVDFFPPTNIKPHHRPVDKKDFQIKPRYQASPTRTHFLEVIPKTKQGEAGRVCRDSLELSQSRKTSVVKTSLPYPEALSPPGLACKRATVN